MNHDYCAVGPRFVLYTDRKGTAHDTLTVRAAERPGSKTISMRAESCDDAIRIRRPQPGEALSPADTAEVLRLFVRVCSDFWGYRFPLEIDPDVASHPTVLDALGTDGFSETAARVWQRPAGLFTRTGPKAQTMEAVYEDLFSVPWNFVPREWDVIGPLIDEAPAASLSVLDLGCGVGKNVQPLTDRGFAVFGVDRSATAIRRCHAVVADATRRGRFLVGSAAALPWRSACFDRVLDVGALHCVPSDDRRLAVLEIGRVLKPGGRMYSRFFKPRPASWLQLQPMAVDRFGLTVDEVRDLLEPALECDSVAETGPAIYVTASRPDLR
jgi:SAM-dependent methyltransferase